MQKDADLELVAECGDGESAIVAVEEHQPDLLLLDIQMPEVSGFEVIKAIPPANQPHVIFVTAYDQYAIKAFEVNAID